jgi:hypothetical protein
MPGRAQDAGAGELPAARPARGHRGIGGTVSRAWRR